jgi:plasmid stabilization system protein ParE
MTRYAVEVTDAALAAIIAQARYIGIDAQEPINASHWLERVWDAVDSLQRWPRRAAKAEEDAYVEYEVRQLVARPLSGYRAHR